MIELRGISFGYAGPLLAEVSLRVGAGEVVAVIGPNGAGKSTLVRLALGLLAPQRGIVLVGGDDVSALPRREIARRVAAMIQEEPQGFPISVRAAVLLGRLAHLPPHGFEAPADHAAADAAMAEVGVATLAARSVHTLSSGERRRVQLARAFAQGAPALVLDEPAANLDLAHQLELFALLRARAAAGGAILVTVHDLNLAARCDRVVLLDGAGAAPTIGAPADVLAPERLARAFGVELERGVTADGVLSFVPVRLSRR